MKKSSLHYDRWFSQAWKLLFKNPIIFFPNIVSFLLSLLVTAGFFYWSGLADLLLLNPGAVTDGYFGFLTGFAQLRDFLFWLSLYFIIEFVQIVYFSGMKYGMAKELAQKNTCTINKGRQYANKYFGKILQIDLLSTVLLFVPLVFVFLFASIFFVQPSIFLLIVLIIFVLIFLAYFFYFSLHFLFYFPTLFFEESAFFKSIKQDISYVKTHFIHTIIVWLIVFSVFIFFFILRAPLSAGTLTVTSAWILLISSLIMFILNQLFQVWKNIFVFLAYKGK